VVGEEEDLYLRIQPCPHPLLLSQVEEEEEVEEEDEATAGK